MHGASHTHKGRQCAHGDGRHEHTGIEQKIQTWKPEEQMIHLHEPPAEEDSAQRPHQHTRRNDGERELEIVQTHLGVAETTGLEHRDLLALKCDLPAHHGIRHERRDTQKNEGKRDRQSLQNTNLVVDAAVRGMIDSPIRTSAAVACEHTIHCCDHRALRGPGCQRQRYVVEGPVELKRGRELPVRHPKNPVGFVIRQSRAGRSFEHKLRRQHDAREAKRHLRPIEHGG